jgi:hypothetical protein
MTLKQTTVVDAIGINSTGSVVLTITDELAWSSNVNEHLMLLQEKLNTYLRFIESGELLETYPDAMGRTVVIDVVCKFPPGSMAREFFDQVAPVVEGAGVRLNQRVFEAR